MRTALAASALAAASGADARFAPLDGRHYRETIVQVRDDGGGPERFAIERTVVFSRDAPGWIATVTFGAVQPSTATGSAALLQRATAALAGTTIRYRLNADGGVADIEDEAFQWRRFVATVATMGGADEARSRDAAAIASALTALPDDQRCEILIEPIAAILAPADAERGAQPATRAMIPARSSLGISANIPGTITVTEAATALRLVTQGEGPLDIGGAQPGRIRIHRSREIDKATGLLIEAREESVTDAVIGGKPAHQNITNTTILKFMAP